MDELLGPAVLMLSLNESFQRAIGRRQFAIAFVAEPMSSLREDRRRGMCSKFLYNEKFGSYSDTKLACVALQTGEYRWGARGGCSSVIPAR